MAIYQISVFLENRAGQLAEITDILSENKIDLKAINIAETADYGMLRLITDDPRKASSVLLEKGCVVSMTPVVALAVPDRPGGLNEVLHILSGESIDIEYMYSVFGKKNGSAYMIFRVGDPDKFATVLTGHGLAPAEGEELGIS